MIMVESRFRVANGMEEDVRNAFLNRPGLVDSVAGFLGMEVFSASGDPCVFHLVTRWTDRKSYDEWHRSEAHHESHAFIPRGLRLDATFTRLTVLERIAPLEHTATVAETVADAAPAIAQWLDESVSTYLLLVGAGNDTTIVNRTFAERIGIPHETGALPLAALLANNQAFDLAQRIDALRTAGLRGSGEEFLLHAVNVAGSPFTLRCRMDTQPAYALILAEEADGDGDILRDELLRSNNLLAVLAREREAARSALESAQRELATVNAEQAATLEALETSYWHIRRIRELLPICMDCGEVKTADDSWQHIREFLAASALTPFLSHGYCPACAARHLAAIDDEDVIG